MPTTDLSGITNAQTIDLAVSIAGTVAGAAMTEDAATGDLHAVKPAQIHEAVVRHAGRYIVRTLQEAGWRLVRPGTPTGEQTAEALAHAVHLFRVPDGYPVNVDPDRVLVTAHRFARFMAGQPDATPAGPLVSVQAGDLRALLDLAEAGAMLPQIADGDASHELVERVRAMLPTSPDEEPF